MGKEKRRRRVRETPEEQRKRIREEIRENKGMFILYLFLRLSVVSVMIAQIFNRDWNNVAMCVLTLLLFMIPSFVEHRIHIDVPNTLEVIILIFIFAAEILGEVQEFYVNVPFWDTMLHTTTGFLCAAIGIALIDILNRSERFAIHLSPFFVALVAFCFSMMIGAVWELYEYAADSLFRMDMQKDTVVTHFSSVNLHPEGRNIPVELSDIKQTVITGVINGEEVEVVIPDGYLDIGIVDTMEDLTVNFIGALVFSVIGYFYVKNRGKGRFAKRFMPTRMRPPQEDGANTVEPVPVPVGGSEEAPPTSGTPPEDA